MAKEEQVCYWRHIYQCAESMWWEPDCQQKLKDKFFGSPSMWDGNKKHIDFKFCPFCGKKLVAKMPAKRDPLSSVSYSEAKRRVR